ncbi:hypothetical protein BJ878DRAFT_577724 [Calycina marina]|uniref:Uncharacterized protein n=1 Tax=Calycina marina TaxID=1763456 RepID=A0A9P7YZ46_9HELO|nr:hypothetical protein BJ878DRAFT_577724 [Calycina marina]
MAPQKRKVKNVNPEKKAKKDAKKKTASDGISKARKALEDGREKVKERKARKEKLEKELENSAEEEAKAMKMEIDTLEDQLQKDERELKDAEAEERMKGLQVAEVFDLSRNVQLRPTQTLICYKGVGFGKPGIVEDFEVPNCLIYRYRTDVHIDEDTPDLMKWRRAGKVNPKTGKKWGVGDMVKILPHIAIQVPPGYKGNPEDLVKLIPKISGTERDALKNAGKRIPKQPEVQMLIK